MAPPDVELPCQHWVVCCGSNSSLNLNWWFWILLYPCLCWWGEVGGDLQVPGRSAVARRGVVDCVFCPPHLSSMSSDSLGTQGLRLGGFALVPRVVPSQPARSVSRWSGSAPAVSSRQGRTTGPSSRPACRQLTGSCSSHR